METEDRFSRRRMLKRIGAGAAIAWTAPALSSIRTPAFAQQYPTRCPEPCDWSCGLELSICGSCDRPDVDPELRICLCDRTTEGDCGCFSNCVFCEELRTCTSSATCPPGSRCYADTCCGTPVCIPDCGADGGAGAAARSETAAGGLTPAG